MTTPAVYGAVRPALQAVALQWEILDSREVRYVLTRPEEFASDLKLLRQRYRDLAQAPPLRDSTRFPPRSVVSDWLAFNRAYREHLETRQSVDLAHGRDLREVIQETDCLFQVWDTIRDVQCEGYYVTVRRQALK
jgi:hypothetical protein